MEGMVKPDANASDEELAFYYFKLHDYDKDDHLDGLELLKALLHEAMGITKNVSSSSVVLSLCFKRTQTQFLYYSKLKFFF